MDPKDVAADEPVTDESRAWGLVHLFFPSSRILLLITSKALGHV